MKGNRMYLLRNIDRLKAEGAKSQIVEYEIIADSQIVGELHYHDYSFLIWEFGFKKEGEDRKLILRIKESTTTNHEPWKTAKKDGFFHGGGIADELIALSSLFLRCRFRLGPIVRMDNQPLLLSKGMGYIDKQLIGRESNLSELSKSLTLVENLNPDCHQKFMLAARLYHQALLIIEEQPDIAYLNLISAIETLSRDYDIGKVVLKEIDNKIAGLIEKIKDSDLRGAIEQHLLKKERLISRRFVTFILNHIEEDFWKNNQRPEHGQIKPNNLESRLTNIYKQRSDTLHSGEPFQPQIFSPPLNNAEVSPSVSVISGNKKWDNKDFIPYPHFFERLVNHVLKVYLKRNQVN